MNHSVLRSLSPHQSRSLAGLLLVVLMGLLIPAAKAEIFCVNTPNGLQNALLTAAANTESDEVRIMLGHYDVPVTPLTGFRFVSSQTGDLMVSGGWGPPSPFGGPNCESRKEDPRLTTLDGNLQVQGLVVQPGAVTGDILIENMTVTQGSSSGSGGGIHAAPFDPAWSGNLSIRTVRFISNDAVTLGAGLFAHVEIGQFRLDNSVFTGNSAGGLSAAADITANGASVVIANNTVAYNSAVGNFSSGFRFGGNAAALLINNVFINDTLPDLRLDGDAVRLHNNFYNTRLGTEPLDEIGSLSGDPMLGSGALSLGPTPGSPLIDGGLPVVGGLPYRDVQAGLRVLSPAVDIGAYEVQIFADGVEGDDDWGVPNSAE